MNKFYGIIVSFIAGISTLIGYFSIYLKGDKNKIISSSLAFAGGVMVTLSLIDLLPEGIKSISKTNNNINTLLYSVILFFIGFFGCHFLNKITKEEDALYKTGIISMIGIILHNIPEGIATFALSTIDLRLGIVLAIAIIFHNIPEGIGISVPIYYSTKSKKKAFLYTFVSGISELFGALIAMIFLYKYITINTIGILYLIIAGLMIYIGYYKLIKTSKLYKKNIVLESAIGSLFIIIVEILLKIY